MLEVWNEIGMFSMPEQQLAGQVLCIRNGDDTRDSATFCGTATLTWGGGRGINRGK